MTEENAAPDAEGPDSEADAGALSAQLNRMIDKVITDGVGPLTGAITWADDRLVQAQRKRLGLSVAEAIRDGVPGDPTAEDVERAIGRLIRESVQAAGVSGFVTSLGGFVTMPVTIPMNVAGALVINARLAAAIAHLRGYEPTDPHVRTVVTLVAAGSNAQQVARTVGVKIGQKTAMQAIKKLPVKVIRAVNKKVGYTLLAKYGTKRPIITLAKGVPVLGGVVGGSVDATMTALVGRTANSMFRQDSDDA